MNLPDVQFVEGLPSVALFDPKTRNVVMIDELMAETNELVTTLFTKTSHHRYTSVLYLVQSHFPKNKESHTISLNSQYMVVFMNHRDASHISHLARQVYLDRVKFVQEAFKEATSVDLKQETPEDLRLCTTTFPDYGVQYVYLPKA